MRLCDQRKDYHEVANVRTTIGSIEAALVLLFESIILWRGDVVVMTGGHPRLFINVLQAVLLFLTTPSWMAGMAGRAWRGKCPK